MGKFNAEQCEAALGEFGFSLVELGQAGAPTPGRIADRLFDISCDLDEALASGDAEAALSAAGELRRLRGALDTWDAQMLHKKTSR